MDIENYFKDNIIVSPDGRESLSLEQNCKLFNYIIDNNACISNKFYTELKSFFSKVEFKDGISDLSDFQTHQNGLVIEKSVVDTFPEYFRYIGDPIMHGYITTGKGYALADLEVIKDFKFNLSYVNQITGVICLNTKPFDEYVLAGELIDVKSHMWYKHERFDESGKEIKSGLYYDLTAKSFTSLSHQKNCNYLLEYIIETDSWYLVIRRSNAVYSFLINNFKTNLDLNNLFSFKDYNNQLVINHLV